MPKKIDIVIRLQHWMDSVPGQTFLNYAYSWGASVVILGALFKLTHLQGGNIMLFLGMGTEVVVFFLSAFDRPFDKNEHGKELPDDIETDEQIAVRLGLSDGDEQSAPAPQAAAAAASAPVQGGVVGGGVAGGPAIVIGGGSVQVAAQAAAAAEAAPSAPDPVEAARQAARDALNEIAATPQGEATMDTEAKKLAAIIRLANDELLRRAQAVLSPEMEEATQDYIDKLHTLNETLAKMDEQSSRLTRDSQEMENLNRTLIGINKIYDLHFASISKQVNTIELINEQTRELAKKIEEVNAIYARMMQTLNVMANPAAAATPQS